MTNVEVGKANRNNSNVLVLIFPVIVKIAFSGGCKGLCSHCLSEGQSLMCGQLSLFKLNFSHGVSENTYPSLSKEHHKRLGFAREFELRKSKKNTNNFNFLTCKTHANSYAQKSYLKHIKLL